MNKRGIELAISTLILMIIGIFVLIGIIYAISGGFKSFKSSSQPFLDTTQSSSIKQACTFACQSSDKITFCCKNYTIDQTKIKCSDSRLELNCDINCASFPCSNSDLPEKCKWQPTKDYGLCQMVLGVYFNGTACKTLSGCSTNGDQIPFANPDECNPLCSQSTS